MIAPEILGQLREAIHRQALYSIHIGLDTPIRDYAERHAEQQRRDKAVADKIAEFCRAFDEDAKRGSPPEILALYDRLLSLPDDIRALGWDVVVHNDYYQNDTRMMFWLFTKDGRAVKGEGFTDRAALGIVRKQIAST